MNSDMQRHPGDYRNSPKPLETAATRQMIREHSTYAKVQVEVDIDLLDQIKDSKVQICLFRIFQEALTNIHKHAQASWY
jgi:signal transduction histidine kinase